MGEETRKNLHTAYEGEAKASVRLKVYAEKADKEEYPGVAGLFRAVAESEAIHARNNLRLLKEIQDTETNLSDSLAREQKIAGVAYSEFVAKAEAEGDENSARMFTWARDVEDVHVKLYEKALEHLLAEEETTYYICDVCGYVADGSIPEKCPVCGSDAKVFYESP
ncbi:MAG: rubrerythrin family protein [Actinobacteria bacterium]|nr:rubrerythrin family protein [Actinomycetota bacterium]MBU1944372.1 rubrerythrin family protein [Actinomycetota bacterium]MBU2688171.1 rubrerythrin family protein [Actinomycetota bacterium]